LHDLPSDTLPNSYLGTATHIVESLGSYRRWRRSIY